MPITAEDRARIELTLSSRDTDAIAKVPDAGRIVDGAQIMHNGVRVVAGGYYGEWMSEIISRLRGHHEPQEEVAFDAVVERLAVTEHSPVIVELGAFWAYYSLWFLHRIPAGRAFLVEPDPNFLELGRRNFELNGRNGTFLQAAVGAVSAPPEPFRCESDNVLRPLRTEGLASLLDRFGLAKADVVLADVQGAELPLLEGGREALARGRVRFLVVSTHHHVISGDPITHQRCLELIRSVGGHVIAEHTVAESFSGDGLIAASFDPRDRDLKVAVSRARAESSLFGDPLHELAQALQDLDAARAGLALTSDELAGTRSQLAATQEELAAAGSRLAGTIDVLEATRSELRTAQGELAAVTNTRTWHLRNRLLAVPGARRVARWARGG